jgi:hypothetical protein
MGLSSYGFLCFCVLCRRKIWGCRLTDFYVSVFYAGVNYGVFVLRIFTFLCFMQE